MQGFLGRAHEPQHLVLLMGKICHHHMAEMCSWVCGGKVPRRRVKGAGCRLLVLSPREPRRAVPHLCPGKPGRHPEPKVFPGGRSLRLQIPEGKLVFTVNSVQAVSAGWHGTPALPWRRPLRSHVLDASQGSALQPGPSRTTSAGLTLPAHC